jgi:hypothetical protein
MEGTRKLRGIAEGLMRAGRDVFFWPETGDPIKVVELGEALRDLCEAVDRIAACADLRMRSGRI